MAEQEDEEGVLSTPLAKWPQFEAALCVVRIVWEE
jgi:hypothetical protein